VVIVVRRPAIVNANAHHPAAVRTFRPSPFFVVTSLRVPQIEDTAANTRPKYFKKPPIENMVASNKQ
jgi:hypothetical protein